MGSGLSAFATATKMRPVRGPSWAGAAKETSKRGSADWAGAAWNRRAAGKRQAWRTGSHIFFMPDNDILFLAVIQHSPAARPPALPKETRVRVGVFTPLLSQLPLEDVLKKLKSNQIDRSEERRV